MVDSQGAVQVHERVRTLVERVQGLPTLPLMLNSINQMILNPRTSPKDVAQIISSDPALTAKVARWDVAPSRLELEITESTMLEDPFRTKLVLDRLHEMGIRLSIDDFGTGYSSLAYLRQ